MYLGNRPAAQRLESDVPNGTVDVKTGDQKQTAMSRRSRNVKNTTSTQENVIYVLNIATTQTLNSSDDNPIDLICDEDMDTTDNVDTTCNEEARQIYTSGDWVIHDDERRQTMDEDEQLRRNAVSTDRH